MAIKKCSNPQCKHDYQDKRYGKGKRVMNKGKPKDKDAPTPYRCTICLTIHF